MLTDMDVKSPTSSYACYEDGVFDKIEAQYDTDNNNNNTATDKHASDREEQPSPKLPKVALGCLVLLFLFSFITIITSGIVFSHGVASSDCLAQSWVMFSVCIYIYLGVHRYSLVSITITITTTTLTLHIHAA